MFEFCEILLMLENKEKLILKYYNFKERREEGKKVYSLQNQLIKIKNKIFEENKITPDYFNSCKPQSRVKVNMYPRRFTFLPLFI